MTRGEEKPSDTLLRAAVAGLDMELPSQQIMAERFFLHRRLGAGGFGVVYEAEDLRDGGYVALKVLNDTRPSWLYRFKREFRSLQGLAHDNLVVLDELFGDGATWFFTMELVDGKDFVSHVRGVSSELSEPSNSGVRGLSEQPLPSDVSPPRFETFREKCLRDILRQLLAGLSALHAANKVHRDIKPSNVLVDRTGRVVIIDFGLVLDERQTTEHAVVGTPAYMAPEQAASGDVGPSADLYAVGVMLYEALTGVKPIDGPPLQVLIEKQTAKVRAPAAIAAQVPDDLNALCLRLLSPDPATRPSAADALTALDAVHSQIPASSSQRDTPRFIGRHAELAVLRAAFADSQRGRPVVVLISGESGIGKSSLMQAFSTQALAERPQVVRLDGKCYEREAIPYKALDGVVEALTRRLLRMPRSEVLALLPTQRRMLTRIFPALRRVPELASLRFLPEDEAGSHGDLRERAFGELRELFTRLAMDSPTVVSIDDLQWADEDGLRALAEIMRPPHAPPMLLLGTLRTGRGEVAISPDRLRAIIPGDLRVLELTPLEDEAAADLAGVLLGGADVTLDERRAIALEAGGHPLFVEELARHAKANGSIRCGVLDDMIWERVSRLAPHAREVAELAAVAGKPVPTQVAASAAGLELNKLQRIVTTLLACNIVRSSGERWSDAIRPYHDRVQEAILRKLDPARLPLLHRALALGYEGYSPQDPEALAMHFREAGEVLRAGGYAVVAGDEAARALAFDRAAAWFEQALALLPEDDVRRRELAIKLGESLSFAGRGALAAAHFLRAAETAEAAHGLDLRRRAAEQLLRSGHFDRGVEASRTVLGSIGMRIPATRLGVVAVLLLYTVLLKLRGLGFRERSPEAISREVRTRIDACMSLAVTLGFVDPVVGFVFQRRALLLALRAGYLERIGRLIAMEAAYVSVLGSRNFRSAERLLTRSRQLIEKSGSPAGRAYAEGMTGIARFVNGRFTESARHLASSFELTADISLGLGFERVTTRMFLIRVLAFLGRFTELRQHQQEGLREALARGDVYASVNMRVGFASLAYLMGDQPDASEREIGVAMAAWSITGFHVEHYYGLLARVWNRLYVQDSQGAFALADELVHRSRASLLWRMHIYRILALHARAGAALALVEQWPERAQLLDQVVLDAQAIERQGVASFRPLARVLRAGVALRRGAAESALRELAIAEREFVAADMVGYAAATADRLARLRDDTSSPSELRRVEELLLSSSVAVPERLIEVMLPGMRTSHAASRLGRAPHRRST